MEESIHAALPYLRAHGESNNLVTPESRDAMIVRGKLHSPEEFLYVDSLTERAKLTAMVLAKIATGEIAIV